MTIRRNVKRAIISTAFVVGVAVGGRAADPGAPVSVERNPMLTPGAILTTSKSTICRSGYSDTVRDVSEKTKDEVFARYGLVRPRYMLGRYEVDHWVPLSLGGSNDITNLYPMAAPEYKRKDVVEVAALRAVCKGELGLSEAQFMIANDWRALGERLGK